jgi:lambda repressor-like predicted transcriptional regulator
MRKSGEGPRATSTTARKGDTTVAKTDERVKPPPIPNVALEKAVEAKGISPRRLAQLAAVDEKTVGRWLHNLHTQVHEDNARRAAEALDCTPHDLWPHRFPAPEHAGPSPGQLAITFNPTMYASRTQVPVAVWREHFAGATGHIDILVFAATFLFDTVDEFTDLLVSAATRGVDVRLLVGDPDAPNMALRGNEEGIGESVKARCRNTVEMLAPYADTAGLQIRTHQTTLYTSIFRVDHDVITNFHIYGSPGRNNPVMVFSQKDEPRLWATLEKAFTQVWDSATPMPNANDPAL